MLAGSHLRWLALLCLPLLLAGCSGTTFFYNRLDFLLPWYAERYVDLDRAQRRSLEAQLEPLLAWHREEELPRYDAFLEGLLADLDAPLQAAQFEAWRGETEAAWNRIQERMLTLLLDLGAQLSEEQVEEFLASIDKRQKKLEDKYLDRDEEGFRDDAYDELRDLLQDYLGRLNREQRARVRRLADELERSDTVWLAERAAWIERLRAEMQRAPGWQERVRELTVTWEAQLDADSDALYERNARRVEQALIDVVNARTERQDRRLRRELGDLREDIAVLVAQGQAQGRG